ncbi:MAG: hypothetical protein N2202_06420 [Proteobacteria bacterium]|nr:hypothetical protein [Pseudomonadota bacterium]
MNDLEKLKVLLPHFIEHGLEHVKTYEEWGLKLINMGLLDLAEQFKKSADLARQAVEELQKIKL